MSLKYSFIFVWVCFLSLSFFQTAKAQQPSAELIKAVPQFEEKINAPDIQPRIDVLNQLVTYKRDFDVTDTILPFNLSANDYAYVIRKIFEKDLTEVDEKIASQTLSKIEFLMVRFQLKEFAKNLVEYIPKFMPNGMDFPRIGIEYGILGALRNLKAVEFAPQIATLLQPSIRNLYDEALSTLIELRSKEAVPALVSLLYDKAPAQRYFAVENLVKVNAKGSAPQIARILKDENLNNRYWALDALVKFDAHKNYVPEIRQMLDESKSLESKTYAIAALVDAGDRQAISSAIETATDKDGHVRGEMLRRLVELKAEAVVPALIEILKDKTVMGGDIGTDGNIRAAVIGGLQNMQAKAAIPVLRSYLRERNRFLQSVAAQALGALGASEAVDDLFELFQRDLPNPPDRITNNTYDSAEAALALAKIGVKKAWRDLIDAAENPHYPYRSQIIVELNKHLDSDLWQKAQEKRMPARQTNRQPVSIKELAEIFSRESGILIVLHFEPGKDIAKRQPLVPPLKDTGGYPWAYVPSDISLLDGLHLFPMIISDGTLPQNFTFVFDDKQIHILTVEKAVERWRKNFLKGI